MLGLLRGKTLVRNTYMFARSKKNLQLCGLMMHLSHARSDINTLTGYIDREDTHAYTLNII